MNYSLIGTGNVAWFFAKRLKQEGHNCMAVYGRNARAANALAKEIYADNFGSIADVKDNGDICILAVSDTAIGEIAQQLSLTKAVLVHTAGSVDIAAIEKSATDRGVIWPVYSILKADLPLHRKIPIAWEVSSDKARQATMGVINAVTDISFEARGEQRKWLHLSAVVGNNFINHLMAICEQICKEQGLPFSVLQPILQQTFDRIAQNHPSELQTGPAKRGDEATIEKHIDILHQHPTWQNIYKAISASIESMYKTE